MEFLRERTGRTAFNEHEAKTLLRAMGLEVPRGALVGMDGSIPPDPGLSFPLIAKVSSSRISGKSEVRGVRPGLRDAAEVMAAVAELLDIPGAEGVLLEEMAVPGVEVIVGGVRDPQFGPVVMFGLGGVFVELFRDVVFGLAPLERDTAFYLMKQVKGYRLLEGYRGGRPADIGALATVVVAASEIMATGLVEEIDLNPVRVSARGAVVLDAKLRLLP